ncbi:MAG: ribonuclease H family protein [Lachnospiraceae bacterium]|nr:ribonuclease H family protein [Lachnospiraceae bacterium]
MSKYYAVKVGKIPGIYLSWDECKENVNGFPGAIYKSFKTIEEAEAYAGVKFDKEKLKKIDAEISPIDELKDELKDTCSLSGSSLSYAFVDGSFNVATNTYGYGGFLVIDNEKFIVQGSGTDEEMASMRNVAGEIEGSAAAVKLAIEKGVKELDIYYDYMGIEMWATGAWKRNKKGTIAYYEYMQSIKDKIKLNFIKVKGHSGIEGNEEADKLAKEAAGIS